MQDLVKKLEGTGNIKGLEESLVPQLKESLQIIKRMGASAREKLRREHQRRLMGS